MPKVLDCTLRDGGYYNDWDFDPALVRAYLAAMSASGVDVVELGYRSVVREGFYGPFRYCPEGVLGFLRDYPACKYAFMIDIKEFLDSSGALDEAALASVIGPAEDSLFSWVRVASYAATMDQAVQATHWLAARGYTVGLNLMGMTLLSSDQLSTALKSLQGAPIAVFYFADSFGSLTPEGVREAIAQIRSHYTGTLGIHTHDNQGLAFANSLAAIEAGVEWLDATVTGMGRGAGNVRTEQLLLSLFFNHGGAHLNPAALLDAIHDHFAPLQAHHRWGWDYSYMLSGLKNIHPTYTQQLKSGHQYTMTQIARILEAVEPESRSRFTPQALGEATNRVFHERAEASVALPDFTPASAQSVLIVAAGPSARAHGEALIRFIDRHHPLVIECNHTGLLRGVSRLTAVLNEVRLKELLDAGVDGAVQAIISGMERVHPDLTHPKLQAIGAQIEAGRFDPKAAIIPAFLVGMFAFLPALRSGAQEIFIAGFDGFSDEKRDENDAMARFFESVQADVKLTSLLPTRYAMPVRSIYSLL
jgi:4-hydroxy 2-oxovalerate aldolase